MRLRNSLEVSKVSIISSSTISFGAFVILKCRSSRVDGKPLNTRQCWWSSQKQKHSNITLPSIISIVLQISTRPSKNSVRWPRLCSGIIYIILSNWTEKREALSLIIRLQQSSTLVFGFDKNTNWVTRVVYQ
jgi:hypothetical protein